ncbi:PPOX class F420-dependent oxidoreductase [Sphaerisporangium sp. NPDC051011]|uniref:PPOX class F420-dependent oxidoreductase n=1 Tax=Sphaerisporangium sp. NPDC051011 TaxID=3155792 RepID=UPI00340E46A5
MTVIEQIGQGRNVSLTTFRRDGRSVATPVWFVVDGGELLVLTRPDSGKVKRIRNGGRVLVAPCDGRGRIAEGAPSAEATARILDEAGTVHVHDLMARRYFPVRLADLLDTLRRRRRPLIGIAVTV